jgi:HEAT repeat protein
MRRHGTFVLTIGLLAVSLLAILAAPSHAQEGKWLAVLDSKAGLEEKSAACRELARVGTKESVPALASLLGDEKLSHMARYALETIRDPSVDDALRTALSTVQGRPRLGVIGSLGVRHDAKAVEPLAALLKGPGADEAQATARALGAIGTPAAATALQNALAGASGGNLAAICEGLLRAAESLRAEGQVAEARAIYDRLRSSAGVPPPARAAALRGAILVRGKQGAPLIADAIRGSDKTLAAAALRAAMELPYAEIAEALAAELPKATTDRRGLLLTALADRGDPRVLPAVLQAAKSDDGQFRIVALKALKRLSNESCIPALLDAAADSNSEVSQVAMETIDILPGKAVDQQISARLPKAEGRSRIALIELLGRRRSSAAAPALWLAADDKDPAVRVAALAALGEVAGLADLPKLLGRLGDAKDDAEAAALEKALREVGTRAADRDAVAAEIAALLAKVRGPAKARILAVLNAIGGRKSLEAVAAAARSDDADFRNAAFRVLGQWTSVDAAPVLLDLCRTVDDGKLKVGAVRAYIRIARQFDMPAGQRAEMCRTALGIAQRDEDKRLVLEILLRYPGKEMRAIVLEAAKDPILKDEASMVLMAMAQNKSINRAELGKALAQAGHKPVKLEIVQAEFGAGSQTKDVSDILRKHAGNYRVIFLPGETYNEAFGGDPAPGSVKQLTVKYRIDGRSGEVSLSENAMIVLPMPK